MDEGPVTLHVTVEPAYPRAGEVVQFRVDATDSEGGILVFGFNAGDSRTGTKPGAPIVDCVAPDPDAPPKERSPVRRTSDFEHVYRAAAQRHFSVMVATGDCSRKPHYAKVAGVITVLPGVTTSNGPRMPEGSVTQNPDGAPSNAVLMSIGAVDRDGVVRRISVDWGDGSGPSVLEVPPSEYSCADEPTAYPSSGDTHGFHHVYAVAGTYTVRATIVSTGCDGTAQQSETVTSIASVEPSSG